MKIRNTMQLLLSVLMIGVLAVSALAVSAQQDTTTTNPPFMGIRFVPDDAGIRVTEVLTGSPAEAAGLQVNDVITEIDSEAADARSFAEVVRGHGVGDTLTLTVVRAGETLEVTLTLGEMPSGTERVQRSFLGVSLEETTDGLTITAVSDGSPAADAGLQAGDVLLAIGDTEVSTVQEAREAVRTLEPGASVVLQILRNGDEQSIVVTVGTVPAVREIIRFNEFTYDAAAQSWTVGQIADTSPLYEAGLREGDVVTAFNGETYDLPGLMQFFMGLTSDATVTLTVQRGDESLEIEIPASALQMMGMPGMRGGNPFNGQPGSSGQPDNGPRGGMPYLTGGARLGVMFLTLDEQVASAHNVTAAEGALITQVEEGSPAAEAGLQVNDIVTAVDGDHVDAEHTLRDRLIAYEPGDTVTLDVRRDGETLQIQVTLGQPEMSDSLPFHFFFGEPGTQQPENPAPTAEAPAA
ncbi:MAG: PDZ domain-containing protein [Anaerolineae bacterium]